MLFVAVYLTGAPNESITLLTSIASGAVQDTKLDLVQTLARQFSTPDMLRCI